MAKDAKEQTTTERNAQQVADQLAQESVAPEPLTKEQLMSQLQTALTAGDYKAVATVSRQIDQRERAAEKAALDARKAQLDAMCESVKDVLMGAITPLVESGQLDKADGVWLSYDFGEQTPTVRLMKTTARAPRAGGGGTGKKFDISTEDMLAKYGGEPYKESGMTIRQAYDSNTDKNFRYAVRQYLLKKEGII